MKTIFLSLMSAIIGGLTVSYVGSPIVQTEAQAFAQPVKERRGPGFPMLPIIPEKKSRKSAPTTPVLPIPNENLQNILTPEERVNVAVYENVNRSVVNITTENLRTDRLFMLPSTQEGTGSGSVLNKEGYIVTNYHVIEDARSVSVNLYDGSSYDAKFIGADPNNDVAVIKIEAPAEVLWPVQFGDSTNLLVGMRVFALGNPFGLERTLSTGIISSLNRSLKIFGTRKVNSIIQVDASMNPGNSGGPLLNSRGQMIGINTAIASKTGQSAGVGFAIPVSLVSRIVPQLLEHGKVIRPEIGIARVYETDKGLLIAKLTKGGAAEKAGLQGPQIVRQQRGVFVVEKVDRSAADLIVELDGEKVTSADQFLSSIESHKPGDVVKLTIIRKGQKITVAVLLGS